MSEPTNLVLNLNEIMKEYTERKEETVQTVQAKSRQSEEWGEVNRETEQPVKESIKRKRGDEEAKEKGSGEKVSGWVSEIF